MRGTIYLGGGGSPDDEYLLWAEMFRLNTNILYWPFASAGDMLNGADAWLRGNLAQHWPDHQLATWTDLDGHAPDELLDFDLLFVGGGNTFDLLAHVASHAFIEPIRSFVAGGGSLYGGSAGAILASDSIEIAATHDDNNTHLEQFTGLRLISGVTMLPHYTAHDEATAKMWHRRQNKPVLGIPERSGLLVECRGARVVGKEPVYVIDGPAVQPVSPEDYLPASLIAANG